MDTAAHSTVASLWSACEVTLDVTDQANNRPALKLTY